MSNNMNTFAEHGHFSIDVSGRVLCAHLSGSWNSQTAERFSDEFKYKAQALIGEPWGHLVLLDDWDLGVPEMTPIIERLVNWCIEQNLVRAAQVFSPSMIKMYQLDAMVVEKIGDFERRNFTDKSSAIAWLEAEGLSSAG